MPREKARDEIELSFGFKQACLLLLLTGLVLGTTFFWGLEIGHRRASRGQPSVLAFLDRTADPHSEPVAIPSVLLDGSEAGRSGAVSSAARQETPSVPTSSAAPAVTGSAASRMDGAGSSARVKPRPAVMPAADSPPLRPDPGPVPTAAPSRKALHYQVAALGVRTNAKALVDWLRREGFPAQIQPARDDGLFRVYVGPFRSDSDAASAKAKLAKNGFHPLVREF